MLVTGGSSGIGLDGAVALAEHGAHVTLAARRADKLVEITGVARHSKAVATPPKDFDEVMNLNLRGAYFLTQAIATGLLAAGKP
jgi:NAD(P)-dependent dehydrogenase (short-subunit alcohol dehydrogenase family)